MEIYRKKHCVFTLQNESYDFMYDVTKQAIVVRKFFIKKSYEMIGTIAEEVYPDYDVELSEDGTFYVFLQDSQGSLVLYLWKQGVTEKHVFLQSKSNLAEQKYIQIRRVGNTIYLFFVLAQNPKEGLLSFAEFKESKFTKPKVIDRIRISDAPYRIEIDSVQKLRLLYTSVKENVLIMNTLVNTMQESTISLYQGAYEEFRALRLEDGCFLILLIVSDDGLYHFQALRVWEGQTPEAKIRTVHTVRKRPLGWNIIQYDGETVLYWFGEQGLMKIESGDGGISWGKSIVQTVSYVSRLEMCSWAIKDYWKGECRIAFIPAIFSKTFSPEFFEERMHRSEMQIGKVFPKMSSKFMENEYQIRQMDDSISKIKADYTAMIRKMDALEKMVAKMEIQYKMIHKQS